jgi:hypothetical protein
MAGQKRATGPTFLVLSEDGAESSTATLEALVKHLFRQARPGTDEHRLHFEPPDPEERQALSGNKWKSTQSADQPAIGRLVRTIANQLARDNAFVVFHFDGDRPYAERSSAENPDKFHTQIIEKVQAILRKPPSAGRPKRFAISELSPAEVTERMAKLLVLTPYYNLEAWTYYNTAVLRRRCRPEEVSRVDEWTRSPEQIEEQERISDRLSVGKKHNRELVEQGFPTKTAVRVGKSFADAVNTMKANATLMTALAALQRPEPWRQE